MDNNTYLTITLLSQRKAPNLPFLEIKNKILGKSYELSLVFAPKNKVLSLNKAYRDKDYIPNILSFPYTKTTGEIFIHLPTAKKQAPDFDMSFEQYVMFLFIHGCLHLKGMDHSSTMEKREYAHLEIFWKLYTSKK